GLDAHQLHLLIGNIRVENAHGIRTAAHRRHHVVGLATRVLRHLLKAFVADDGLEIAHHAGVRVRPGHRADDIERVFDVGDPVAHGFVERVFQGTRPGLHRHHGGAQQLHPIDIGRLAPHVFTAHVHHTFHAIAGRDRGRGNAMLARAGLGDDARLAHVAGQQRLANAVIDLVCARMVEVFALEPDLRAAQFARPALGVVHGAGPPDEVLEFVVEGLDELGVEPAPVVSGTQFGKRVHQRFGDEHAAILAEMALGIRKVVRIHQFLLGRRQTAVCREARFATRHFTRAHGLRPRAGGECRYASDWPRRRRNFSQSASWSRATYSSALCACSIWPGPHTTVGTPRLWNRPASVPYATLRVARSLVRARTNWVMAASSEASMPGAMAPVLISMRAPSYSARMAGNSVSCTYRSTSACMESAGMPGRLRNS